MVIHLSICFYISLCFRFTYDEHGREVGVCINNAYNKHDFLRLLVILHNQSNILHCVSQDDKDVIDQNYRPFLAVHRELRARNVQLFDELKTEKLFNISMVAVDPDWRGKGVATHLIRRSVLLAGTLGFSGIMTEATGSVSKRMFATVGMQSVE